MLYLKYQKYEFALLDYNLIIERDPKITRIHYNKASVLNFLGQKKAAIESLNDAIDLKPKFARAFFLRGIITWQLKLYKQALFDLEKAYKYMKRGALVPRVYSQKQEIRPYLEEYIKYGQTFASMSLEYASSDFAISQFALSALSNRPDYTFFKKRSQHWKNIYNSKTKWLNSRYPNGVWKEKDHDWREGTYKNYFWMVPFSIESLINKIGGKNFAENSDDTSCTACTKIDYNNPAQRFTTSTCTASSDTVFITCNGTAEPQRLLTYEECKNISILSRQQANANKVETSPGVFTYGTWRVLARNKV